MSNQRSTAKFALVLSFVVLILCICGCMSIGTAEEYPAWLQGTLMINVRGSENIQGTVDSLTDQYICAFDFSNQTTVSTKIPSYARLMKYKDDTILFYKRDQISLNGRGLNRPGYFRTYLADDIAKNEACDYTLEECSQLYGYTFSVDPIIVYGVSGEGSIDFGETGYRTYCYLGYGVSKNGDLEYQLLCEKTSGEKTVLHGYPLNYNTLNINVSVSSNGNVAWRDLDENGRTEVLAFNGEEVLQLQDEELSADSICWMDADRLLYTADVTDMSDFQWGDAFEIVLRVWHTDTGTIEDLNSGWAQKDVLLPRKLKSITVDADNNLMAGYISPTEDDFNPSGQIAIVSLISGDYFTFIPWNLSMTVEDGSYIRYGKDDNGVIFYDPGEVMDIQLVWDS